MKIMKKNLTYAAVLTLLAPLSAFATDSQNLSGIVSPSSGAKLTLHLKNDTFGPGHEDFDKCQESYKKAYSNNNSPEVGDCFQLLVRDQKEDYGYYRYDKVMVKFDVLMRDDNASMTTKGIVVPYDIKKGINQFTDFSINLSQEKWKKVFGYTLTLYTVDQKFPGAGVAIEGATLGNVQAPGGAVTHFYKSTTTKGDYHVFHKLDFQFHKKENLTWIGWSSPLYEDYTQRTSIALELMDKK